MLIVLGNGSLAAYPQGGGHWSWFLQFAFGLRALGHRVFWLEILKSSGNRDADVRRVRSFFDRIGRLELDRDCAVLVFDNPDVQDANRADVFGASPEQLRGVIRDADLMWNLACGIRDPLLSEFRRPVLVDVDPGHLQISAVQWDLGIASHRAHLTVGGNVGKPGCDVPTLGIRWRSFLPFVFLPMWQALPDPGPSAPFTSITQWTWETLIHEEKEVSVSKRDAYLRYADLPARAGRRFELACNIGETDPGNDRPALTGGGWSLADPHEVAATPESYRDYIGRSRAEIQCPKPVYRILNTGWFSDRSVGYLASGRPVLAENTGCGELIPVGRGVLAFSDIEQAVAGVGEIDSNYAAHSRAARDLAVDLFDSQKQLKLMLDASF
jgi:hypothetical protein